MARKDTVLVAMSGGVDSSVTAALLQRAGYEVRGVYMRLGVAGEDTFGDASTDGADDARLVADMLGIELDVLDFREQLKGIVDYFVDEYRHARTPNPCVLCNRRLKFGALIDHADEVGAKFFATGHYARMAQTEQGARLCRAWDYKKDQSYVLFGMGRENQGRVLLPLGDYHKVQVRSFAQELKLPIHDKSESQEICFIPDDDYARVVAEHAPELVKPGVVINSAGEVLGEHNGIFRYTIGQRRGLGIALGDPAYVIRLDAETNTVVLGSREELLSGTFVTENMIWLVDRPVGSLEVSAQIRYNHRGAPAKITPLDDGRVRVDFAEPVSAVTPGQAAVFYDKDGFVLGGGWIASPGR
ncbi:MAG: tRNA 2-thiouridine(34) synthase MnmA [Sedimentisphaerales bacterium]|nr:tRNA 2-thiouridine(34) synthase MnmA [Sedimentisphaerales bacterium]